MELKLKFSVEMTLYDILYLSYLVPASHIRSLVPEILPLATVDDDMVFVSVVTFHSKGVRLVNLPSLRFTYDQINLRTYVKDPQTKNHGVYFLRSGITSASASLLTQLLNLPWENIPFTVTAERDKDGHYVRYLASGDWQGKFLIEVKETVSQIMNFPPFATPEEAIQYLTGPLIGFYGSSQKLRRFEVKHSHIQPRYCEVLDISFPLLTASGLLKKREIHQPHNALLAPQGQFHVYLPPRSIKF